MLRRIHSTNGNNAIQQIAKYLMLFKLEILIDAVCINMNQQQFADAFADVCYVHIGSFVAVHHTLDLRDHTQTGTQIDTDTDTDVIH